MIPLEQYERDNNISPIILVENLLEKFLYDHGYIKINEEITTTPEDIYNEREIKFKIKKLGKYDKIFFEKVYLGMFKNSSEIINKLLLNLSDDEIKELDYDEWINNKYPQDKHNKFLYAKLENPILTPEEFIKNNRIRIWKHRNNARIIFNKKIIADFNKDKYSNEKIDEVYSFLTRLTDDELLSLINERKNSKLKSAKFILKYMDEYFNNNLPKKDNTTIIKGKYYIQKHVNGKSYRFGGHNKEKIDEVLDFLKNKKWDIKYASNTKKCKRKQYTDWLYSEIEKNK